MNITEVIKRLREIQIDLWDTQDFDPENTREKHLLRDIYQSAEDIGKLIDELKK